MFDEKIGEESVEVGRTCRTNERGSTTKDGICSPGEGKEKERKTTYEMARLHRERHEKGGVGGRGLEDGGPGDSGGGSSTGRQRRVATLTPEIRETRKREFARRGSVVVSTLPGVLNCMSGRLSGFPSLY